jgi:hypothetical protein
MFVITACIIGCSGKKAETAAPKENAEIIVEQAEIKNELPVPQQAVEAEEIPVEQIVTAPVEEEPAEKPVATTPAAPAAPQKPAAPKYAIGDKGPGGGMVFSASGGKYKEMYIDPIRTSSNEATVTAVVKDWDYSKFRFKYGSYSDWIPPTIYELRQFYETIVVSGIADYGNTLVTSRTRDHEPISGAPGYFYVLCGEPPTFYDFSLNDGQIWKAGAYVTKFGSRAQWENDHWGIVRSF